MNSGPNLSIRSLLNRLMALGPEDEEKKNKQNNFVKDLESAVKRTIRTKSSDDTEYIENLEV